MSEYSEAIPDRTLEAFARGFFSEANLYGFRRSDYVRFVNHLLDLTISMQESGACHVPGRRVRPLIPRCNRQLPLNGNQVSIRMYNADSDAECIRQWLDSPSGCQFLRCDKQHGRLDLDGFLNTTCNHFGVVRHKCGEVMGALAYVDHSEGHRRAELRILPGGEGQHQGEPGSEALRLWLAYGKNGLGLRKVVVATLDTSARNVMKHEGLGFEVEGLLRNELLLDGAYRDLLRMSLSLGDTDD